MLNCMQALSAKNVNVICKNYIQKAINLDKIRYNKYADEKDLFGIEYKDENISKRLSRIEENIFGEIKTGTNAIRIKKWCEKNYGDKPREEKNLPSHGENASEEEKEIELVETHNDKTIEDVCKTLNLNVGQTVKALLMNVDNELVITFKCVKIMKLLNTPL